MDLPPDDLLVYPKRIIVEKRRVPDEHLVREDPTRPPVDGFPVSARLDDLGSEVLGCAAQRPRPIIHDFREAKIRNPEIPPVIQQEILGLEIPVDDVVSMEVFERQHDAPEVEARDVRCEASRAPEVGEEFAARDVGEEHVDVEVVLERRVEIDDEGVLDAGEDLALGCYVLDLAEADNFGFAQDLHGEVLEGVRAVVGGCPPELD